MIKEYRTIYQDGMGEIVEKKSRFITHIHYTETEEEAIQFIEAMKKKYWDATHNCSAYIIGKKSEIMRCSDDGEPSQTAGKPMLDVLSGQKICNVTAVVTRYFGGTLLGTGGLVRAYSGAVKAGLEGSVIVDKKLADELLITADYTNIGKIQYILAQEGLNPMDTSYTDKVEILLPIPVDQTASVKAKITEGTNGRAVMEEMGQIYYGVVGKETILFED
ncbi:MAG: YigZ family protein [Lachnospiraceae bacterium]